MQYRPKQAARKAIFAHVQKSINGKPSKIPVEGLKISTAGRQAACKGQARNKAHGDGKKGKQTTPPATGAKEPLTPLKIRAIFLPNHFQCNSILQKRNFGLENHGENTFCVQENVEKRGILGGTGLRVPVGEQMSDAGG